MEYQVNLKKGQVFATIQLLKKDERYMLQRDQIVAYLKQYKDNNTAKYNIQKLGIFGSVAKNRFNDTSDLDVVVHLAKQDLFDLIGIKQDLEDNLNISVDVVSYRETMNSFLRQQIDRDALYV